MKITIYELIGLVKDGKAPKKIKYDGNIYVLGSDEIFEFFTYKTIDYNKFNTDGERLGKALFLDNRYMHLYDEVEILDEEGKIEYLDDFYRDDRFGYSIDLQKIKDKINELIDEINNLKEK